MFFSLACRAPAKEIERWGNGNPETPVHLVRGGGKELRRLRWSFPPAKAETSAFEMVPPPFPCQSSPQRLRWSFPLPRNGYSNLLRRGDLRSPAGEQSSPLPGTVKFTAKGPCAFACADRRVCPNGQSRTPVPTGETCSTSRSRFLAKPRASVKVASQPCGCGRSKPLTYQGKRIFFPITADMKWKKTKFSRQTTM